MQCRGHGNIVALSDIGLNHENDIRQGREGFTLFGLYLKYIGQLDSSDSWRGRADVSYHFSLFIDIWGLTVGWY